MITALHPVNGFLLLLVATWIAPSAWEASSTAQCAAIASERAAEAGA